MHSTAVRRAVRIVTASTVAVAASAAILLAPVSAEAGHTLHRQAVKGHTLG